MTAPSTNDTVIIFIFLVSGCYAAALQSAGTNPKHRSKRQTAECTTISEGQILFGGPREQLQGLSLEECITACENSRFNFQCKAANYYANDQECLLYDFNSVDKPDQVLPSPPADAASLIEIKSGRDCPDTTPGPTTPGPTTLAPRPGFDCSPQCCSWARIGECERNQLWMKVYCQLSCGTPGATFQTAPGMVSNPPAVCRPGSFLVAPYQIVRVIGYPVGGRGGFGGTYGRRGGFGRRGGYGRRGGFGRTRNQPCSDASPKCSYWAQIGECRRNPYWMKPFCQASCKSCGSTLRSLDEGLPRQRGRCRNKHFMCNFWASVNECRNNNKYMLKSCCFACRNAKKIKNLGK